MLKDVRERKGYTIKQLANESGVSATMIKMIESGYKSYKRSTIWKLANTLGVEAEEIEREE